MKKLFIVLGIILGASSTVFAADSAGAVKEAAAATNKICPVSGHEIGSMGEGSDVEYQGKKYKLCCKMCEKDFLKNPEEMIKKLGAGDQSSENAAGAGTAVAAVEPAGTQAPAEIIEVGNKLCPISHEEVDEHGKPVPVEYKGKRYNLCCKMCEKDFLKDPEAAIKKLEAANATESPEGHGHEGS